MLMSPLSLNHGRQQENHLQRDDSKSPKSSLNSEVILILGEPTPGDLSAILRWGVNPTKGSQKRLLIFASDIHDLPQSALQTQFVDIHILPKRLGEISGSKSQSDERPGEAIHQLDVLERASQFAATWRADADQFIHDNQLSDGDPQFSSRRDSARLSDQTHAIDSPRTNHSTRTTPSTSNDDIHVKLGNPRYAQSNSSSKFTASRRTFPASKGLLSNFLSFTSPSVPRPSSPSICHPQSATHSGFRSHNRDYLLETYSRTFDTVLNFLPPEQTEKSLLKQVILLSTLCGQYFARSEPEILSLSYSRAFASLNSRANSPRRPFPSSSGAMHSQNLKENPNSIFSRNSTTESSAGEARRTSTASSGYSASGSASPARSSTPSETSRSTTLFDTPKRRSSMLSWLSTTSASQASDPESGADSKLDTRTNFSTGASQGKSVELRRRLTFLFGHTAKRPESPQGVAVTEGENDCKRRRKKFVRPIAHKHAYLIHVLPTSLSPGSASTPSHKPKTKNEMLDESELLEKRRSSLPSPSTLSGALNDSTETAFTHARMQSSFMRRATLQQTRLDNLERRRSMPAASVGRVASRTTVNTMSRGTSLTRKPVHGVEKIGKPPLADQLESFLEDYFGQGNREVLPFVLENGVFGREVDMKMGKRRSKKVLVGEAVLSGLLDDFAMNWQCWVGDEDVIGLVEYLKAGDDDEESEESVEEEIARGPSMVPKHPPPAAISPSSSEGFEGAGPVNTPTSQRTRSRALSDTVVTSKHNPIPLPRASTLKAPEPAHIYPPSRPAAISQPSTPTHDIAMIPAAKRKTVAWFEAKVNE